jgi:L-lactate dehydrogenase
MGKKVTIIGAGSVGSTIAYTMAVNGIATEVVMIDINESKSLGEALDIRQGVSFCPPISIYAGSYEDAKDSDIVILTSGVARKPGQSRLDLAQTNVNITKSIIPNITKVAPNAIYLVVANPVDILTYTLHKCSNIPANHIIGSGTILDTARLRARLADYYDINLQNIHAYVYGEHGDSSFVPWSLSTIANVPVDSYMECLSANEKHMVPSLDHAEVENYMRKSGGKIIARKGATFYAVAVSVCHIVKSIFSGADTTLTVSTMHHGEYGLEDICLSTLALIGPDGVKGKIVAPLTEEETALLHKSADSLRSVMDGLTF